MKRPPDTPEFAKFTQALGDILKVSPSEMQTRIGEHKKSGKRLSKGVSLAPAASRKLRNAFDR